MATDGLRARKKRETRLRISGTAMQLFRDRGFDQVTVAEVAVAAGVSEKTVFNYFAAKEDLVFDLDEEMAQRWAAAAAAGPGLAGLRDFVLALVSGRPAGLSDSFRAIVAGSTRLQIRGERMRVGHEQAVAAELARRLGTAPDDPVPAIIAQQVLGVQPLATRLTLALRAAGRSETEVRRRARELVGSAFDLIEGGLTQRGWPPGFS